MENNVVEFKPRTGYEDILFYLNGLESENTYKRYRTAIERFIRKQYDIPLQHVTPDHFNQLTYMDMKKYRDYLRRKGYAASSVNNEMVALYNLMKELNKIERDGEYVYNLNVDQLRVKSLRVREVESSGDITWDEVTEWIHWIKESGIANADRKWILIHTARLTGLRKEALAQLTYRDIRRSGEFWQIKSTLKGKTTRVSIKDEDAELLFSLHVNKGDKDEKVFKMSTKTMDRLLDSIKIQFQIPEERNVTFHSLRGLSIYESYLAGNNSILVAQRHGNHESIETTFGYIKRREEVNKSPSLYMGKEFTEDCIKDLTLDQWKEVYQQLSRSAKYEIYHAMERLGYSQE